MKKIFGFTLIEVLVSIAIIASGLLVVYSVGGGNLMRIRKSRLNTNVAFLLERKMTELEAKYRDRPLEEIVDEKGNFGDDYSQYRWEFETREFEMPDMTPILVGQEGGADETLITVIRQTQEWISASIKEGRLSVFVKSRGRELRYSVTTYFIDYDKNLSLAGAAGG